jgi:pseudaminic acid synthase
MSTNRTFVVAELSANHGRDLDTAIESIREIKRAGADAAKIQTYTPDTLTIDCDNEYFQISQGTLWDGTTLYELYRTAYTPWEWHAPLKEVADDVGIEFFSTPFDFGAVDFLEKIGVPHYKIASFEITDIPLIEYTAARQKPIIISTGIATLSEIEDAVMTCRNVGNDQITLLKCTSSYPAPVDRANLMTMVNMRETFGVRVGLSDHTLGADVAIAAVALGAEMVEKHFILDRSIGGPDADFSLEASEFRSMVTSIRNVEKAIGVVDYTLTAERKKSRKFARSLFVVRNMAKGETFTNESVRSIRPSDGLAPRLIGEIVGRKASCDIKRGTPLEWSLIG